MTSHIPFLRQRAQLRGGTPRLPLRLHGEEGRRGRGRPVPSEQSARTSGLSCVGAAWGPSEVSAPPRPHTAAHGQLCSGPARGRLGPGVRGSGGRTAAPARQTGGGPQTPSSSPAERQGAACLGEVCGDTAGPAASGPSRESEAVCALSRLRGHSLASGALRTVYSRGIGARSPTIGDLPSL